MRERATLDTHASVVPYGRTRKRGKAHVAGDAQPDGGVRSGRPVTG